MFDRTDKPPVLPAPGSGVSDRRQAPERRAQGRVAFTAAAQVYDLRLGTRVNGRCSDLSAGGCYIDTLTPLEVGAKVKVRIEHESRLLEASGVVAYAHLAMGMGVTFTEIEPEYREALRSWITSLGNGEAFEDAFPPAPAAERSEKENVRIILQELIRLLVRKEVLTDEEAARFLRREPL